MVSDASDLDGCTIAVTGGLGSIGSSLVRRLLTDAAAEVRVIDNRETELFRASERLQDPRLRYLFGDVRDEAAMADYFRGCDYVFHAAAMKHVGVCEQNSLEAVRTNVLGTHNCISAAEAASVGRFVLISTDKAVNPVGVMGTTKSLAEKLVASRSRQTQNGVRLGVVRFGNVLYSRGGVLEVWAREISGGELLSVTDPDMTRFVMGIPQSMDLVVLAASQMRGGETFVLKMPSCRVGDLAEAFLRLRGLPGSRLRVIGPRAGEKRHEDLIGKHEAGGLLESDQFLVIPNGAHPGNNSESDYREIGALRTNRESWSSDDPSFLIEVPPLVEILRRYDESE